MGWRNHQRMGQAAEGDAESVVLELQDGEKLGFGGTTGGDVFMRWDGSIFECLPKTDDTGAFNIGDGTYDMDFKVFMGSTSNYVLFDNSLALVSFIETRTTMGTSGDPLTLDDATETGLSIYTTSASAHASNSAEAMYVKSTMTGAGGVGGRSRFHMYTNVALGSWSNALKAYAEYGSAGRTAGLGSAFCAEIALSAGTISGTYAPLETELTLASGGSTGTATSFLYGNVSGTGVATLNSNAYLFQLGAGVTIGTKATASIVSTRADGAATHAFKCLVGSTTLWLLATTDAPED